MLCEMRGAATASWKAFDVASGNLGAVVRNSDTLGVMQSNVDAIDEAATQLDGLATALEPTRLQRGRRHGEWHNGFSDQFQRRAAELRPQVEAHATALRGVASEGRQTLERLGGREIMMAFGDEQVAATRAAAAFMRDDALWVTAALPHR